MTASAPSIGPSPENCDVSTVTRWPSRARYFVIPATLRAATTKDGGEYCATSRIERPFPEDMGRNLAAVRADSRRTELVASAAEPVQERDDRPEHDGEPDGQVEHRARAKAPLSEPPVLEAVRQAVGRRRGRELDLLEARHLQEPFEPRRGEVRTVAW